MNRFFTIVVAAVVASLITWVLGGSRAKPNVTITASAPRKSRTLAELSPTWWADYLVSKSYTDKGEVPPIKTLKEQYEFSSAVVGECLRDDLTEREAMEVKEIMWGELANMAEVGGLLDYDIPDSFEALESKES
jgi:hypothetical protein